jgi:hypothetical protein
LITLAGDCTDDPRDARRARTVDIVRYAVHVKISSCPSRRSSPLRTPDRDDVTAGRDKMSSA